MASLINQILSNRYLIEESLGRGGMADVYRAWDQDRATYLAIKVLRQDLARDTIFLRRFQREAITLEKLKHPNIVRFYGIEKDDLVVFMIMEYIDGSTLQDEIFRASGRLLNGNFISIVMNSICSALHYAHRQGLVHCDIKPGNVMINRQSKVYLTDFGIARMTDAATATMVGFGTPAYMSPELARGQDPTPQSDIYSLGVVMYEMVTGGERPFTGSRARTTGATSEKVRWEQVYLDPPRPSQYNPHLNPELEGIILKCLLKQPHERFSNITELTGALHNLLRPQDQNESIIYGKGQSTKNAAGLYAEEPHKKRLPKWAVLGSSAILILGLLVILLNFISSDKDIIQRNDDLVEAEPSVESQLETEVIKEIAMVIQQPTLTQTVLSDTPEERKTSTPSPIRTKSSTRTSSIYVTPKPKAYYPLANCAASHLHIGDSAFISYEGGSNFLRSSADTHPTSNIIGDIYEGEVLEIIGGPECNYGWILWKVRTTRNQVGWTAETDGEEFWLLPLTTREICEGALPTRLVAGKKAKVNEEPPDANLLREGPGRFYTVIDRIKPGHWMMVLEGPECGEAANWWKVKNLDTGTVGWTMEGNLDIYYLSPDP